MCTARFKTLFPLAVPSARHKPCGGEAYHLTTVPFHPRLWGETESERQWKKSFEPVQVDRCGLVSASKPVPGVSREKIWDARYC